MSARRSDFQRATRRRMTDHVRQIGLRCFCAEIRQGWRAHARKPTVDATGEVRAE
jgi:hypothetical protein